MTADILELHGHGDDLLVSTMKDVKVNEKALEEKPEKKADHQVMGHGDPLFAEVLSHSSPPKKALHSEFLGHGDELLEEVIDHWDDDLKKKAASPKKLHELVHSEFKVHGDPYMKLYLDNVGILSHSSPPKKALHPEFLGHGDELFEEVINHWDDDVKKKAASPEKLHELVHSEFKVHGDPFMKLYLDSVGFLEVAL